MNSQFQVTATLPPEKQPLVPIQQDTVGPRADLDALEKIKNLLPILGIEPSFVILLVSPTALNKQQ